MAASRLKQVASFCCRIRSLAWANAASAVLYGSVSWHAVEVNIGDQEDLPRPPMRTLGGDRLCELLKRYDLGVRTTTRTVEDVAIDAAFFADI